MSQLAALAELDLLFSHEQIAYWLFGGWAVDFHVGRVTRAHDDIDIAVWWDDRDRVAALLARHRWAHRPDAGEDGYTCYERDDVRLEVAFIARDEHGNVYTPVLNGRAPWPPNAFGDDIGELPGARARVISRASLRADKSVVRGDTVTDGKDKADLLCLGLERHAP